MPFPGSWEPSRSSGRALTAHANDRAWGRDGDAVFEFAFHVTGEAEEARRLVLAAVVAARRATLAGWRIRDERTWLLRTVHERAPILPHDRRGGVVRSLPPGDARAITAHRARLWTLPLTQQHAHVLRHACGLRPRQIATVLDIELGEARRALAAAEAALRERDQTGPRARRAGLRLAGAGSASAMIGLVKIAAAAASVVALVGVGDAVATRVIGHSSSSGAPPITTHASRHGGPAAHRGGTAHTARTPGDSSGGGSHRSSRSTGRSRTAGGATGSGSTTSATTTTTTTAPSSGANGHGKAQARGHGASHGQGVAKGPGKSTGGANGASSSSRSARPAKPAKPADPPGTTGAGKGRSHSAPAGD